MTARSPIWLGHSASQQNVRVALSRAKKAILTWLGLPAITNKEMRILASLAVTAAPANPEAIPLAPARSRTTTEEAPMHTTPSQLDQSGNVSPTRPRFPKPNKAERDTLLNRRRTLRATIKQLLKSGSDTIRHDQLMCVLSNRDTGRISRDECDQRWTDFAAELGLDESGMNQGK
jgi:hypothetical protein